MSNSSRINPFPNAFRGFPRFRAVLFILSIASSATLAAQNGTSDRLVSLVDTNSMWSHLRVLAHDSLEGRGPGTRGGRRAAEYIAREFQRYGLEPAGDSGSYFHRFPVTMARNLGSSVRFGTDSLLYGIEQVVTMAGSGGEARVRGAVVFVGYGIAAPEWDDFAGVDVRDKIVIALGGVPPSGSPGLNAGRYGTRAYKTGEAARRGAFATLVIHTPELAGFPWSEIPQYWSQEIVVPDQGPTARAIMGRPYQTSGWLSRPGARHLLREAGLDLDQLIRASATAGGGTRELPASMDIAVATRVRAFQGQNVIGRLPGQGPLAHEAVVVGAHYDHLGLGDAEAGDSIYNGAEDNAGGTAQLLGIAEAFGKLDTRPARSILFVAFDGEEAGYLGSEAFVRRPPVPIQDQVAMLNLDGINLYGETRDAAALGLKESTLDRWFRRAAEAEGMVVAPSQPDSIEAFFLRSDQLPFAEAGVPAIFVFLGWDFVGRTPEWASRQWSDYFEQRYHRPSDQMQPWFSMGGAAQQARVTARMAWELANDSERPAWATTSRFRRQ